MILECKRCTEEVDVKSKDIADVICDRCSMLAAQGADPTLGQTLAQIKDAKPKKPRAPYGSKKAERLAKAALPKRGKGWHLKGYFEWEGQIYSFGQLVTDPTEIARNKAKYVN